MPPSHADAPQTLQRAFDQSRDTLRFDALAHTSATGTPPWSPVSSFIGDGDPVLAHAYVWNGSAWVEFTG